ncbi:MAG: hypothetical protein WD491_02605 [Balneolales bacterium]
MEFIDKAVNKVKDVVEGYKDKSEKNKSLQKWQSKFEEAKAYWDYDVYDTREALYLGTRDVDKNVNSTKGPSKKSNNVNNIIYEFIESQIDTQIPQPSVRPKRDGFQEQSKMIEDSVTNDLTELGLEEINDENERITPVQGLSLMMVDWDPDYKHQLYRGELRISNLHPKQIITQPGVWKIQKMDYFFILSSVTKDYIERRYDVDVEEDEEQYPEVNSLDGSHESNQNEKVTEIVAFYRDKDGDVCKFVWCNDQVLEDYEKYYYRRQKICAKCETPKMADEEECQACGHKKFKDEPTNEQTLIFDTQIAGDEILQAGEKIPYFVPTRYPVVKRVNVPKNFSFEGQSDVDIIRDQQDSIKKITNKMEEKIVKGGTLITLPEDMKTTITNETYQIIYANPQQAQAIQTRDLTADISRELEYLENMYQTAQSLLGITDSFQGKRDPTAESGKAKQIQVEQASGRLQSKTFNKYTAYKELFEIMFEFKLAFYDELRPYVAKDENGKDLFQVFDKYKFLVRDDAGELYYNTDFMFSADAGEGLPKDRVFMFNQAKEMLQVGALDIVQYWTLLDGINFPMASDILAQVEQKQEQAEQMQQQQEQVEQQVPPEQPMEQPPDMGMEIIQIFNQLAPEEREAFFNAQPEQQAELMQQMIGGAPVG